MLIQHAPSNTPSPPLPPQRVTNTTAPFPPFSPEPVLQLQVSQAGCVAALTQADKTQTKT